MDTQEDTQKRQPIFNAISPIIFCVIGLIAITSIIGFWFTWFQDYLQFIPSDFSLEQSYRLISYGFVHSDYMHLGFNALWLLIFASPIVQFFGGRSFLIIFACGLIVGSAIFLTATNPVIVIGASAGVSACIGAALRFMLRPAFDFYNRPLLYKLTDGRFLFPSVAFCLIDIGQAFFMSTIGHNIAWQSHLIGFVVGAFLMEFNFINHHALKRNKLTQSEETYLGD
ncbi:MAG: membrane associated rhomboid family serine protease [Dasania sp.]|jgi:membrane associated rhomboid family serine protease